MIEDCFPVAPGQIREKISPEERERQRVEAEEKLKIEMEEDIEVIPREPDVSQTCLTLILKS